ncbi:MAG TPA: benzoate-CoA ligase family protein [Acidimicrobiia bacterium]|nr:benzoate-CoA ligase family protein [Acidimicrobiia bacterium]
MRNASTIIDGNLEAGRSDALAIVTNDDKALTFGDLYRAVCRVAAQLSALGVRREERVLLILDDTPAFPAAFLGAMRLGAVPIPVNFQARSEDFGYFLDDSYAVAAIVDDAFVDKVSPQFESRPHVRRINADIWMGEAPEEMEPVPVHPDDAAFWLYSSGSTGPPKGVIHRHGDIDATWSQYAKPVLGLKAGEVVFSSTKMYHAYGLGNSLTFPLSVGATSVYLTGRPTPDRLLERISEHRPDVFFSVPALFNAVLAQPQFGETDWSSVRLAVSAAEPLPPEIWHRFFEKTGIEILDGLGSTEMLHIYCSNRAGEVDPGSSGSPVEGYEVILKNEEGTLVPDGEAGEMWVRGPSAFAGYWHQAERTRQKLVGGWFASGDRYHRNERGNYVYEGRVDDMMKIGGLWVSPIEIENRLIEHDAVREAAVVSVQIDSASRIKAAVILVDGRRGDDSLASELREWCKGALLRYQYPHVVEFVEDFPRTTTGKIQRFKLRS